MIHHAYVVVILLNPAATIRGVRRVLRKAQKVLQAVAAALKSPAE